MNTSSSQNAQVKQPRKSSGDLDNECPICQMDIVLPTTIPSCKHKFCFICLKGVVSMQMGVCPICRGPIDESIVDNPKRNDFDIKAQFNPEADKTLVSGLKRRCSDEDNQTDAKKVKDEPEDEDVKPDVEALKAKANAKPPQPPQRHFWLYQARRQGWWRFDPRIENDIEAAKKNGLPVTEVWICGRNYVIDFVRMVQFPKGNDGRLSREVKRVTEEEFDSLPVKGMAGVFAV
ncbi:unnamed protein product [Caenorhabditis auriculariae]|uniref:E3 ubiquitin-protein ligase n=1 Tax=Caenorhabditis auriculariae TaxID=2777116 RepID=A0A8S1GMT7_9PELO|nr:unnamed protein product [Caenorhabditis auriculariae]